MYFSKNLRITLSGDPWLGALPYKCRNTWTSRNFPDKGTRNEPWFLEQKAVMDPVELIILQGVQFATLRFRNNA